MKETISDKKLQSYYLKEEISDLFDKSTYLDPHFKVWFLTNKSRAESQIKAEEDVCMNVQDVHNEPDPKAAGDNVPPMKKTRALVPF